LVLVPLYLWGMTPADEVNLDAEVAALPAWRLAQRGSIDLTGVETVNRFVVPASDDRLVGDRPLALSLIAVPAYLVTNDATFSPTPASVTALAFTASAMGVMHVVLRRLLPFGWAVGATFALALGTATWAVSAAELWPHGPGQLMVALSMLAASSGRTVLTGIALAGAVLLRPVAAVFAAVTSIRHLLRRRWLVIAAITLPAVIALALVAAYNAWTFGGGLSISGGYSSGFRENATGQPLTEYLTNLWELFVSRENGLLLWSPVVAVAALGLRRSWSTTPGWASDAALAGLVYVLVHARLNRASGGLLLDYRYPLEPLTLATPALALAARSLLERHRWWRHAIMLSLSMSIALQGLVAVRFSCDDTARGDSCSVV
jgi:hypothetical protein